MAKTKKLYAGDILSLARPVSNSFRKYVHYIWIDFSSVNDKRTKRLSVFQKMRGSRVCHAYEEPNKR